MTIMDVSIPEVQALPQQPRFFERDGKKYVEISFIGSKDTLEKKVTPEIMAKFPAEWAAYCDGRPLEMRQGTPLTDLTDINEQLAKEYIHRNVHTLEEMSFLSDAQCQALGHGTLTLRKKAQQLVTLRKMERANKERERAVELSAEIGSRPAEKPVDLTEIKDAMAEQGRQIAALAEAMKAMLALPAPRKPGRPPKERPDA